METGETLPKNPVTKTVVAVVLGRGGYCGLRQQQQARRTSQVVGAPNRFPLPSVGEGQGEGDSPRANAEPKSVPRRWEHGGEARGRSRFPHMTSRTGMPVQGPGERSLYPAHVFPFRWAEEAAALARGANQAMTGADLSDPRFPEGRRSGDVGGAGLLTNIQATYRTRPQRRGDPSTTTRRTKNPPKGRIKRVPPPFAKRKGDAASEARRRGMHRVVHISHGGPKLTLGRTVFELAIQL